MEDHRAPSDYDMDQYAEISEDKKSFSFWFKLLGYWFVFVFIVSWELHFTPLIVDKNGTYPLVYTRSEIFTDKEEAELFVKNAPKGKFECINSYPPVGGMCEVKGIDITEK